MNHVPAYFDRTYPHSRPRPTSQRAETQSNDVIEIILDRSTLDPASPMSLYLQFAVALLRARSRRGRPPPVPGSITR
jgi:hypothetical protein